MACGKLVPQLLWPALLGMWLAETAHSPVVGNGNDQYSVGRT